MERKKSLIADENNELVSADQHARDMLFAHKTLNEIFVKVADVAKEHSEIARQQEKIRYQLSQCGASTEVKH